MRTCLLYFVLLAAMSPGEAAGAPKLNHNELSLEGQFASLSLQYFRRVADAWFVGGGIGAGYAYRPILTPNDHLSKGKVFDLASVQLLARYQPSEHYAIGFGLSPAYFVHIDDSDDDFGGGFSVAGFADAQVGWRFLTVGTRVQVAVMHEEDITTTAAFQCIPVFVRATLPW